MDTIFKIDKILNMKTWIKVTLVAIPVLVGGFLVYKQLSKRKGEKTPEPPSTPTPTPTPTPITTPTPPSGQGFPIKKGSKGAIVRELQSYLLRIDNKSLPKFGLDGDFGSETQAALKKITGKSSVDTQVDFDAIKNRAMTYQKGSPLVFQYDSPMQQITPFLTIK
jgi:hypothetical protein